MNNIKSSALTAVVVGATFLVGNTAFAWDPIKDITGKWLDQHINNHFQNKVDKVQSMIRDPIRGPIKVAVNAFLKACGSSAEHYGDSLATQADGKWKSLPRYLGVAIQRYYSNDLSKVQ